MIDQIMIDILPLSLLLMFLFGLKLEKPLMSFNVEGYLTQSTGKYYRGLFAVAVVFHHLAQRTETGIVFRAYAMIGCFVVAFFFFLTGYGLQKSYITKQDSYKKSIFLKRIPSVLIPYIIINFFYWLMYYVGGQVISLKAIIISILRGNPIASYSWYIINILFFYVVFQILMLICKKRYFLMILGSTLWYILYVLLCMKLDYGGWWYNATHLLIVGMLWATYEKKILDIVVRYYYIITPVIVIGFIAMRAFPGEIYAVTHIPFFVISMLQIMFFVLSVILFSLKTHIGNKVLGFLGNISLEMYISQGLLIKSLRSGLIYIENELLWCTAVLAGTIIFSYFLNIIFQKIMRKYNLLLCKLDL